MPRNSLAVQTFASGTDSPPADFDMVAGSLAKVEFGSDMADTAVVWRTEVLQLGHDMVVADLAG